MKTLLALLFCCVFVAAACGDDPEGDSLPELENEGDSVADPADGTSDDAPLGGGSYPIGEVSFVVTNPDGSILEYSISCIGDTATVFGDINTSADTIESITGDKMCRALADAAVQDRLIEGEPTDQACTEIFGSEHTAEVTGTIDGRDFTASFHRNNGCGISDWDTLMIDLLPLA